MLPINSLTKISLVLPCFNPPENWEKVVVQTVLDLISKNHVFIELILVNDGSTNGVTKEHINYLKDHLDNFIYVDCSKNSGKGAALRAGVKKASEELVIYTDIDFPYTKESLLSILNKLNEGNDIALGHRGENYYTKTPFVRKYVSKLLRWSLKTFLRLPTDDSQCGIKGFNSKGATIFLDTQIDRFLFDLEFIKLASKSDCKIVISEVVLKPNVVFSKVNLKILSREALNFIKVLFRK